MRSQQRPKARVSTRFLSYFFSVFLLDDSDLELDSFLDSDFESDFELESFFDSDLDSDFDVESEDEVEPPDDFLG